MDTIVIGAKAQFKMGLLRAYADTVGGANASANLYSLLQTCVANGIDGYQYLRALLVELPKAKTVEDFESLLPWRLDTANR